MGSEVNRQAGLNEKILTFDVPDDALERAATAEQKAHIWLYCTYAWYNCGWPQSSVLATFVRSTCVVGAVMDIREQ
jgi:hypothetical protein